MLKFDLETFMTIENVRFVIDSHDNMFVLDRPVKTGLYPTGFYIGEPFKRSDRPKGFLVDPNQIYEISGTFVTMYPDRVYRKGIFRIPGFSTDNIAIGSICLEMTSVQGVFMFYLNSYWHGEFNELLIERLRSTNCIVSMELYNFLYHDKKTTEQLLCCH